MVVERWALSSKMDEFVASAPLSELVAAWSVFGFEGADCAGLSSLIAFQSLVSITDLNCGIWPSCIAYLSPSSRGLGRGQCALLCLNTYLFRFERILPQNLRIS